MTEKLLPCPFCGGETHIERVGTPRQSCIVACGECGWRLEAREETSECGGSWNRRAALQSQTVIDDDHISIVLDVYDNAMQKAFDGREFPNPCKPGTLLYTAPQPADETTARIGAWLSAALDDPAVCQEMKGDIRAWFKAGQPNVQPTVTATLQDAELIADDRNVDMALAFFAETPVKRQAIEVVQAVMQAVSKELWLNPIGGSQPAPTYSDTPKRLEDMSKAELIDLIESERDKHQLELDAIGAGGVSGKLMS